MKRIRVQLTTNIRGPKQLFWPKGTIFDTKTGPLPKDIEAEVLTKSKNIKFLPVPDEEEGAPVIESGAKRGRPPKQSTLDAILNGGGSGESGSGPTGQDVKT